MHHPAPIPALIPTLPCALVLALCLSALQPSRANDSSFADDNGSLRLTTNAHISMDKETLLVSEQLVRVDYVFTNTSTQDLGVDMTFPMPPMYFGPGDHNTIEDFRIWVNGAPLRPQRKLVALLNGQTDVMPQLTKLGWTEAQLIQMLATGQQPRGKKPLPAAWFDAEGQAGPRIRLHEWFVWRQHFPAGQSLSISHSYKPGVSTGVPQTPAFVFENFNKLACIDAGTRAAIRQREGNVGVMWAWLRYVLVTGNNWQGPIKDFTLRIRRDDPRQVISTCFEGALQKVDAHTFEFRARNWRPQEDLGVLFIGPTSR